MSDLCKSMSSLYPYSNLGEFFSICTEKTANLDQRFAMKNKSLNGMLMLSERWQNKLSGIFSV